MFGDLDSNSKGWRLEKLSDVAEMPLHYGSTASAVDYDENVRYVRITDIGENGKLNQEFKSPSEFSQRYLLDKGDILFARSGSVGLTYEYREDYRSIFAGYLIRFKPNKARLNPTFVYYFTRTEHCQSILLGSKRGGVQKNVNAKQLSEIVIPVPPINIQQIFVEFTEHIDKLITTYKQIFQSFDNLVKSRFNELFGECEEKIEIGKVCSLHSRIGWQALTKAEHMKTGEYMLVTGTDFIDGRVNWAGCKFVSKERYEMDPNIIIQNGDILVTKDGTIGKVAIVENIPGPATLNAGVFVVRNKDNNFLTEYLQQCLLSVDFQRFIENVKRGATIVHLNQEKFVKYQIPVTELAIQQEFVNFVKLVNKSKFAEQCIYQPLPKGLV